MPPRTRPAHDRASERHLRDPPLRRVVGGRLRADPRHGTSSSSSASSGGSSGASDASSTSSTTRPRLDAQKLCTRLIDECGQALTMPECISTFGPLRVTEACIAGIDSATCADLNASSSSVLTDVLSSLLRHDRELQYRWDAEPLYGRGDDAGHRLPRLVRRDGLRWLDPDLRHVLRGPGL